jgi:hypothetical protein
MATKKKAVKKPVTKKSAAKKKRPTKSQIQVAIAKDVVKQVKLNKFIASRGNYLEITDRTFENKLYSLNRVTPKKHVQERIKTCSVCAIGGVFVAAFNKFDKLSAQDLVTNDDSMMVDYLKKWFPTDQLRLMEAAFEDDQIVSGIGMVEGADFEAAQEFRTKVLRRRQNASVDAQDRALLLAIMENVVKNKGTFVPA